MTLNVCLMMMMISALRVLVDGKMYVLRWLDRVQSDRQGPVGTTRRSYTMMEGMPKYRLVTFVLLSPNPPLSFHLFGCLNDLNVPTLTFVETFLRILSWLLL